MSDEPSGLTLTSDERMPVETDPGDTYLDEYVRVFIGPVWDIGVNTYGEAVVYRKGNYLCTVPKLEQAVQFVSWQLRSTA